MGLIEKIEATFHALGLATSEVSEGRLAFDLPPAAEQFLVLARQTS